MLWHIRHTWVAADRIFVCASNIADKLDQGPIDHALNEETQYNRREMSFRAGTL
jgi:hypothetical protein